MKSYSRNNSLQTRLNHCHWMNGLNSESCTDEDRAQCTDISDELERRSKKVKN